MEKIIGKIENVLPQGAEEWSEKVYMAAFSVCLVFLGLRNTTLNLSLKFKGSMIAMCGMLFLALMIQWLTHIREIKKVVAGILLIGVYGIILVVNRHGYARFDMLTVLILIICGAVGINYRKFLKRWVYTVGTVILITFSAAIIGAVENLVRYSGGIRLKMRGSLGVIYPTDTASWILMIMLMSWIAFEGIPDVLMIIIAVFSLLITKGYCDSRCSTICTLLFILVIIYRIFEKEVIEKRGKLGFIKKTVNVLSIISVPVGAILIFILSILYGKEKSIAYRINKLIDYRLQYSWEAIKEYGIKAFGSDFKMNGDGANYIRGAEKYTFLDSSYVNIAVRFGLVTAILLLILWIFVMSRAIKINDRRMLLVMALVAVHSFEEHHFIEILYNPITALTLCSFVPYSTEDIVPTEKKQIRQTVLLIAGYVVAALIFVLLSPWLLSIYRTVIDIMDVKSRVITTVVAIILILLFLTAIGVCIYGLKVLIMGSSKIDKKQAVILTTAGIVLIFLLTVSGIIYINLSRERYEERIEADRSGIDLIMENKEYPVYANEYPYAYMKAYKGLSQSIWTDEDMARIRKGTLLFDSSYESNCAIMRGYMYVQISDHTGVYTNDKKVIDAFSEAGYHVTGYYSSEREMPIKDGEIERVNILPGKYKFTAVLKKEGDTEESGEGKIATLNLIRKDDEVTAATSNIYSGDFDDKGTAYIEMMLNTYGGIRHLGYEILPSEKTRISLHSLNYVRKPDYDIHCFYNDIYQVTRKEYYDGEGKRITSGSGEAACEYEYDDKRNVTVTRYYGMDYKPVLIDKGYAEIHNEYDDLHHVTAIAYFGTDGNPIALEDGRASEKRELDHKGNIIIQKYFGTDGTPTAITGGYAELDRVYDKKKRVIREEYKGIDGNPVITSSGYASLTKEYDDNDNVTAMFYYDTEDRPVIDSHGYAGLHREFDEYDRIISESYYGIEKEPVINEDGYASLRRIYDENDRIMEESYYGTDDELINNTKGYAIVRRKYDPMGRMTEESYYGTDGKLTERPTGQAFDRREYDKNGKIISRVFYDVDGEQVLTTFGFSEIRYVNDENGNRIRVEYYDPSGNSVKVG